MPIAPGATPAFAGAGSYVFDLGYYDYAWWAKLDRAQCRIVTRLKADTPLTTAAELPVPAQGPILSDRIGHLPPRQSNRLNPFQDPVREVRVKLGTGKVIRILSNDLDASAQQIADLYKRRWAIERFLRWVKQTLKIRRFLGTSENAVRIQIAVARVAFVLLRLRPGRAEGCRQPARLRPPGPRQPDAPPPPRSPARNRAAKSSQPGSTGAPMEPNLNRTAVEQVRPSTETGKVCAAARG
jgi:Transposase DDE domain